MKRLKRATKVWLVLCFTLLITNCNNDESAKPLTQEAKISEAKAWFKDYESSGDNFELFQNLNYDWSGAETKMAKDGTEIIIVPVIEQKKDQSEIWEQRLYIYKGGGNDYKALLYEMYPDDRNLSAGNFSFDSGNFSGYIAGWDLKTGFVKAAKFVNDKTVENGFVDLISNERLDLASRTNLAPDIETTGGGIALREIPVQNNYRDTYIVYIPRDSVNNSVGSSESYTSSHGGDGGGSGVANTPVVPPAIPPSCESFNFASKKGANWQEALVKNVNFKIVLLTPPNHIQITQIINYPQPISFGMPINFNKGNIDVTPGVAATVSARILQLAMDNTVAKYGKTEVSELTVRLYFQEQLIKEYREYSNGGIVNFNSTSNITATQYKTNASSSGNCN